MNEKFNENWDSPKLIAKTKEENYRKEAEYFQKQADLKYRMEVAQAKVLVEFESGLECLDLQLFHNYRHFLQEGIEGRDYKIVEAIGTLAQLAFNGSELDEDLWDILDDQRQEYPETDFAIFHDFVRTCCTDGNLYSRLWETYIEANLYYVENGLDLQQLVQDWARDKYDISSEIWDFINWDLVTKEFLELHDYNRETGNAFKKEM